MVASQIRAGRQRRSSMIFLFLLIWPFCFAQQDIPPKRPAHAAVSEKTRTKQVRHSDPHFGQGDFALTTFIYRHMKKNLMIYDDKSGEVVVSVLVDSLGTVSKPKMFKSLPRCAACNEEALRIIRMMPNWIPAFKKNADNSVDFAKPMSVRVHVPFYFRESFKDRYKH
jgi:hypothetical protein